MVVTFHSVGVRVRVRLGYEKFNEYGQTRPGSFHRSFRGSIFFSQKLSRKSPWHFILRASVDETIFYFF